MSVALQTDTRALILKEQSAAPAPALSDQVLVEQCLRGDESAFRLLMQRYSTRLYYFAARHLSDTEEAYDVVQDTFVSVWESLHRYDSKRPFEIWLRRIALNKCRDRRRRAWVRRFIVKFGESDTHTLESVADPMRTSEEALSHREAQHRFENALSRLPLKLREPLLLTVWEGLSNKDAAEVLGINVKAVENRLYRAKKQLSELLDFAEVEALLNSQR